MTIGKIIEAQGHLVMAVDYLQRIIDCLDGGKDTDLELDLSCAQTGANLGCALLAAMQEPLR